ncbi:MAG: hypothetical protein PHY47_07710 [Lachnospiraceae bacterium]|nr:hypothetical protein [Lachnospiraceae bacterium]
MNRKIGVYSSIINIGAVVLFAISMLIGSNWGGYVSSMFIAFSFVLMMCSFCMVSKKEYQTAGYAAMIFGGIYATIILLVYFAQVTTVHNEKLLDSALAIIDYQKYGLFFNYDLLGYALMALATFFAGLTITYKTKTDKALKVLLLIHGVFFISCLLLPVLGVFKQDMSGGEWIGTAILLFWCIYFIPIGVLSAKYFRNAV